MKRSEIKRRIEVLTARVKKLDAQMANYRQFFGSESTGFADSVDDVRSIAISAVQDSISDDDNWVRWYVDECKCGDNPQRAGKAGAMKPVKSVDDLIDAAGWCDE